MRQAFTMRLIALLASFVLCLSGAYGKEYGHWDARRILTKTETPSGMRHGIDLQYLDQMLNDLAGHARNYPPSFESEQDRQRATQDAGMLSGMLDILVNGPSPSPEILFRAAFVNAIAHNLRIPGAADKAAAIYQRLLTIAPDHPRTNHHYGMFLAGTARLRESIPYLEKAWAGGTLDAAYSLAMVHLGLGDKVKALDYLERYEARAPAGTDVSRIIEAIKSGRVEIRREEK